MNYHDYLEIDRLLSCQKLESAKTGKPAHDEMLFIIVHQVYELWFKQILTEVGSVLEVFSQAKIDERQMDLIVARLQRVVEIQKLLVDQVRIMETMTPLDFLEFRDLLIPASGFQSQQFRQLEIKLGLKREDRLKYNESEYYKSLKPEHQMPTTDLEKEPSLFTCIEAWLERTPFLSMQGFDFWQVYKTTVETSLKEELQIIDGNPVLSAADKGRNQKILNETLKNFAALFDEDAYQTARGEGKWRLSYKATHAALLIQLYRDQPVLQLPFRLLTAIQDIDEWLTTWRYRHALMAKRMLGSRVGTGGSSGHEYLKDSTEKHKIFQDFFQLTTFFVPRSKLPVLPSEIQRELGFYYSNSGKLEKS